MGGLLFALLISLVIGGGVVFVWFFPSQKITRGAIVTGILIALIALGVQAVLSSWTEVEFGTVAVVTRFGKIVDYDPKTGTGRTLKPGLWFIMPFFEEAETLPTVKYIYEVSGQPEASKADYKDYRVDTGTHDGQQVHLNYTVRFSVDPVRAAYVLQNFQVIERAMERVVKTDSRIWARIFPRAYTATELYGIEGQLDLQQKMQEKLELLFLANGLLLDEFGLRNVEFEPDYLDALELKQIAYEGIATAKYEAEQEIHRKQGIITQAQAEAEKKRTEAGGEADALREKGMALRAYPEVLDLEFIRSFTDPQGRITWGILPQGMIPFLDILELEKQMGETP